MYLYRIAAERTIEVRVKIMAENLEDLDEAFDQLTRNLELTANRKFFIVHRRGGYTNRALVKRSQVTQV